ncbi:GNAT superfamily N-acetyltransferase [Devosia subaequoris]|uniref:GNAT superfamily N-acetyltransferase n=1 Tax=Devosia subaequoris TaxID=395930 RepID=A0A7W6IJR2_9HYPH|nr:GNAT family N-acetyltransferase [Devosia subaequoris]MBB4050897.1 GNAT superfamily N-acetyltransferase [Devosia subaequoris]MCP1208428.1 GNAT family N-acetyltransferase [Devosia subaequoris]
MLNLRPYRPDDLDALYAICLQTGDASKDATALHSDPQLVGHIYSAPYGILEPDKVFVAEDDDGVAGYVVGTHDSIRFAERLEQDWWPDLRARYADASGMTEADRDRIAAIKRPEQTPDDIVAAYPAHIHMNLLSRLRGQRVGTRLLEMWVAQAKAAGVTGIHLGASASNSGGIAFWTRSGFEPLREEPGVIWFGMTL